MEIGRRQQRMGENIQTMQERVMEAMNKYKGTAEYSKQKHDTKIYNVDDEISPGGESTQELRKAKTSHLGKDQTMSK
jgi:glutamine amidotransferase PdxT